MYWHVAISVAYGIIRVGQVSLPTPRPLELYTIAPAFFCSPCLTLWLDGATVDAEFYQSQAKSNVLSRRRNVKVKLE